MRICVLLMCVSVICGDILNQSSGEIRSMDRNKDGLYDNNLDCHWTIVCGPNQLVELRILSIELEMVSSCFYDYIEVSWKGKVGYIRTGS